ncbi:NAD(+) diphosphatase [Arthrobacter sp. M4]|uniref:NAD(+) diphosphatase n=1 Tax=Arthrobacter sp. M4 TaxID=218160 RepID=UPI001CDD227D|nr:NAD(+) diphosphatase [Arthrobacter sp. M4]MCA4132322.1 NAD(+) diphosphatase [Arthrobacter sp. M4]
MSHAQSAAPAFPLMDTVLPVRPARIDRGSVERLKPGMVETLIDSGEADAILLSQRRALIADSGLWRTGALELRNALTAAGITASATIFLGRPLDSEGREGTPHVLFVLDEPLAPGSMGIPDSADWIGFREIATQLDELDTALFVESSAISNWHATHTHCPQCGHPTNIEAGGWVRRCPRDNSEHYPRTDPAIIVTVIGPDGRILLGGGGPADAKNFSTLAGFVEPGESLEQAVVREIFEEVGIRVTACQYLGSQSWPFPASLMLGFTATTDDVEARPDGVEVTRARWFTREELQSAVLDGEITISTRLSIARSLIEHWYGGIIEDLSK